MAQQKSENLDLLNKSDEDSRVEIWNGSLVQIWKASYSNESVIWEFPCSFKCSTIDNQPELKAETWPKKLILRSFPEALLKNVGLLDSKNSKIVHFYPSSRIALAPLIKMMGNNVAGCVNFPAISGCDIKVLILRLVEKKIFLGFIPNQQQFFVDRLEDEFKKQKILFNNKVSLNLLFSFNSIESTAILPIVQESGEKNPEHTEQIPEEEVEQSEEPLQDEINEDFEKEIVNIDNIFKKALRTNHFSILQLREITMQLEREESLQKSLELLKEHISDENHELKNIFKVLTEQKRDEKKNEEDFESKLKKVIRTNHFSILQLQEIIMKLEENKSVEESLKLLEEHILDENHKLRTLIKKVTEEKPGPSKRKQDSNNEQYKKYKRDIYQPRGPVL